ncbi:conserved hypothetical protein [Coccidioides posadasii str. Silveira]|uniref:Uncharacterized protein n=1 Tax=Coccidioides posadasii (strain RMSCC 757 / Silveira) TaxID=443226 RepID=E9DCI2_COCPS|nr:conserved hypothetical protein [Coccidioides posadasii str. Silveira]
MHRIEQWDQWTCALSASRQEVKAAFPQPSFLSVCDSSGRHGMKMRARKFLGLVTELATREKGRNVPNSKFFFEPGCQIVPSSNSYSHTPSLRATGGVRGFDLREWRLCTRHQAARRLGAN